MNTKSEKFDKIQKLVTDAFGSVDASECNKIQTAKVMEEIQKIIRAPTNK